MRMYSTSEMAQLFNIEISTVRYRIKALEIHKQRIGNERSYFYTKQQYELIRDFKPKSRPASKKNLYQSNKIEIVEFFKENKSNTMETIREVLYFNGGC